MLRILGVVTKAEVFTRAACRPEMGDSLVSKIAF